MKLPSKVITIHHNPVSQPGITTRAARHHDLLLVKISRHLSHYSRGYNNLHRWRQSGAEPSTLRMCCRRTVWWIITKILSELLYTVNYLYFNFYDIPLTTTESASIYIGVVELNFDDALIFVNTRRGVSPKLLLLRRCITAVGTNWDQHH